MILQCHPGQTVVTEYGSNGESVQSWIVYPMAGAEYLPNGFPLSSDELIVAAVKGHAWKNERRYGVQVQSVTVAYSQEAWGDRSYKVILNGRTPVLSNEFTSIGD